MSRPRRRLAALITFGVTLVLTAVLGSSPVGSRLGKPGNALLANLISGVRFPRWTVHHSGSVLAWVMPMIADLLLAVLAGVVAALVVSVRSRFAALLAGWGLTMVLAAAIGAGREFALEPVSHLGTAVYGDAATAITAGLWFGLAAGWLNGVVLAAAVRKNPVPETAIGDPDVPVSPVRIFSPTQPDWQHTQDLTVAGLQPGAQPTAAQPGAPGAPNAPGGPPTIQQQPWPPVS